MTDPFDTLRDELVTASARRASARSWWRPRAFAAGLATVAVAGSATAAVITRLAEPSAPLAGPLPATQNARGYAVSITPDLRAGQVGWCTSTVFTVGGRPSVAEMGCGPAATKGSPFVSAGGVSGSEGVLQYAVVTSRVTVVVLGDGRRVIPRADQALPNGWRAAVSPTPMQPRPRPYAPPSYEDVNHKPIAVSERGFAVRFSSQPPARTGSRNECRIGDAAGYESLQPRVATPQPQPKALENAAFASCARTIFRRGGRNTFHRRTTLIAAILLDAQDPAARAAELPRSPNLTSRRLARGWLVVSGGTQAARLSLLDQLRAHA